MHRRACRLAAAALCLITASGTPADAAVQLPRTHRTSDSGSQQPLTSAAVERFADSAFAAYVRDSPEPSLALIVVRGDSLMLQKGYGLERTNPRREVDPESTLFNIASVSKLITATAVMQLVDEGQLALDDRVGRYLAGTSVVRSDEPITVVNLLTHTSGLDAPFMRDVVATPSRLTSLARYFDRYPLRTGRPPGREIRYSNHGMALAGHLVERISTEEFSMYAERHVLGPLAMRSSSFRQPPPAPLADRIATAGSGAVPNVLQPYPAGSMISTVSDMGRFMRAHLNGGQVAGARILSERAIAQMHTRQWAAVPGVPGVTIGFFESDIGGVRGLFHTGARTHFSLLYLFPDDGAGIYIVHSMRQGGPYQTLRTDFVRAFIERFIPPRAPTASVTRLAGSHERAARFGGTYRPVLLATTTIERAAWLASDTRVEPNGDGLTVHLPGGHAIAVSEMMAGVYRATSGPDADVVIAFSDTLGTLQTRMSLSGGTQDPVSFDRLSWYRRGLLHVAILAACFGVFAMTLVGAAAGWLLDRLRRRPTSVSAPALIRRARRTALIASALIVGSPVLTAALVVFGTVEDAAAEGLRRALAIGLVVLLAGCIVALTLSPFAVLAWRAGASSRRQRIQITSLAVTALVLVPLLAYYRLLGVWF